jgi:thiosulfate/3-mercaptopyruvate sulfurtransferase
MPNSPRSSLAEYLSGPRIPGARRFDLDHVAELGLEEGQNPMGFGHMMPSLERFREECREYYTIADFVVGVRQTLEGMFAGEVSR